MANEIYIRKISLESFRGVPRPLTLNLEDRAGNVVSALIIGDNGTGKSSIIDAVEFALFGRVRHYTRIEGLRNPEIQCLTSKSLPHVCIELTDGSLLERQLYIDEKDRIRNKAKITGSIKKSICILRRSDILQFWNTPEVQRQILFFGFMNLNTIVPEVDNIKIELESITEIKHILKNDRNIIAKKIAEYYGIDIKDIPKESQGFNEFIRKNVYRGLNKKQREAASWRGIRLKFDENKIILAKEYANKLEEIDTCNSSIKAIKKAPKGHIFREQLANTLKEISPSITESFMRVSPCSDYVEGIELSIGRLSDVSLNYFVKLKNSRKTVPEKIFSEANLDILALIIFVEMIRHHFTQDSLKTLILDDVFQSVDAAIRLRLMDLILERLNGWQLIITLHDRLWLESLLSILRIRNYQPKIFEVTQWNSTSGPNIVERGQYPALKSFFIEIDKRNVGEIVSYVSLELEKACGILSYQLPISVTRKKDDKYTLGDLWPGVAKALRKTKLKLEVEDLEKFTYIRNIAGAHFNEWAQSLSREEAMQYAKAVERFIDSLFCESCSRWVSRISVGMSKWSCKCEKIVIN